MSSVDMVRRFKIKKAKHQLNAPPCSARWRVLLAPRLAPPGGRRSVHILAALKATGWMLSGPRGAATRLGINRSTLQFRMKKLGIERPTLA